MKTSHYLKKAGAVCMAAAMMTGCASGSSGANGKTLTVGLNTGFNGIFSPLFIKLYMMITLLKWFIKVC